MRLILLKFNTFLKAKSCKQKANGGFTLLEVIVALGIFSVGTAVAVNVIIYSIGLAPKIKNRTIAVHLAQEGIELVKNVRDINWVNGNSFNIGLTPGWGCVGYNILNSVDYNCSLSGGSDAIYYDGSYYSHDGTAASTNFTRRVTLFTVSASEIKVVSSVTCGANCAVSLEDHLFDWK